MTFWDANHGVAEGYAVIPVPKRHRIDKYFRIFVLELQLPRLAGVRGFVNARSWTIAGTECVGCLFIDGVDVAEVESFIGYRELLPRCATINRAQHRRSRTTRPSHAFTHRTHPAQPNIYSTRLHGPVRRRKHYQRKARRNLIAPNCNRSAPQKGTCALWISYVSFVPFCG